MEKPPSSSSLEPPATDWSWLMAQAQKGSAQHFVRLLEEIAQYMRPFLARRMHGLDEAEDVLQEILLTIHRARHTYDPQRPFKPWLFAVANSRVVEFWRQHKRRADLTQPLLSEHTEFLVAEEQISQLNVDNLVKVLEALPDSQREVVRLLKLEGLSIKEVAARMSMSESAVKVTAHRGYQRIIGAVHHGT